MPQPKRAGNARPKKPKDPEPLVLRIDGEEFALSSVQEVGGQKLQMPDFGWMDRLSFREQIDVRRYARELSGKEDGELGDFGPLDLAPALLTVVAQRSNEDFTLDEALEFDWEKASARPPKEPAS